MSKWTGLILLALTIGLLCPTLSAAFEIPLTVEENVALAGARKVTGGVPLLPGQAKDIKELRLVTKDAKGKVTAVPAQFRELARWFQVDNSLRWVLVDFATFMNTDERKTYYLTNEGPANPAPDQPAAVTETDDAVTINTGPAKFVINKKKFALLQSVVMGDQELLDGAAGPDFGTVITDTFGEKYYCSEGTKSVKVAEAGPLRVCVRAQGRHLARDGKGYSKGMYGYDYILNFYAGSSAVSVDCILTNNPSKSIGTPLFKDASLLIKLKGGAKGTFLYGTAPTYDEEWIKEGNFLDPPAYNHLGPDESVCIYQDTNGSETWKRNFGFFGPEKAATFRGYRMLKRSGGKEEVITQGDHARGLAMVYNDVGGMVCHTRDFWEQYPMAVEVGGNGLIRVGLFPGEYSLPHYIEDGSAKGHEIFLHFFAKDKAGKDVPSEYSPDEKGRTWAHYFADLWDSPVYPRPTIEHCAATGALADFGPYSVPTQGLEGYSLPVNERRWFHAGRRPGDYLKGNAYGWMIWGERWETYGGHSTHGARQPIKEDNYLFRYLLTGRPEWLELGWRRGRNYRDVRAYRIDDQEPFDFTDWQSFSTKNLRETGFCSRPQPTDDEIKKYTAGKWDRTSLELPNPEHTTLDLLYDRYLMFGDMRSYENMRIVAANGAAFAAVGSGPHIGRDCGWSMRALVRYYDLTGDAEAKKWIGKTIDHYAKFADSFGGKPSDFDGAANTTWLYDIFSRGVCLLHQSSGDERMLTLIKALTVGKDDKADCYHTLFAYAHHVTGDEKYKDALVKKGGLDDEMLLMTTNVGAKFGYGNTYEPANSHWLITHPPITKKN